MTNYSLTTENDNELKTSDNRKKKYKQLIMNKATKKKNKTGNFLNTNNKFLAEFYT